MAVQQPPPQPACSLPAAPAAAAPHVVSLGTGPFPACSLCLLLTACQAVHSCTPHSDRALPTLLLPQAQHGLLQAHEEALEAAETGAGGSGGAAAPAPGSAAPSQVGGSSPSPLSPSAAAVPRLADLKPSALAALGAARDSSELAEPLLAGQDSIDLPVGTPRSSHPSGPPPASDKDAAAAAAAVEGGGLPGAAVTLARDPTGGDRDTDISRALVFGLINSIATIPVRGVTVCYWAAMLACWLCSGHGCMCATCLTRPAAPACPPVGPCGVRGHCVQG